MAKSKRKAIAKVTRESVANRQAMRCANRPDAFAVGCKAYVCPMWSMPGRGGAFDEAGYEIDHVIEVSHGGVDAPDNLQALCPCCHAVKTKRFLGQKRCFAFHSSDLHSGRAMMECDDAPLSKKRRKSDG